MDRGVQWKIMGKGNFGSWAIIENEGSERELTQ
jgi:hypothetical protein